MKTRKNATIVDKKDIYIFRRINDD